ncbi:MAG: GntR family transcriptional regulator [Victivallaceae bacterium]|nr:GntR family transcriptional regulator [Victivallaceae bacterium]
MKIIKTTPKYEQLANEIRNMIRAGKYSVGSRLPSERELAEKYNVNLTTVNKTLSILQAEGLLYREHGRGTFVKEQQDTKNIGFIGFYMNQNSNEMINGIEEVLSKNGYRLTIRDSNGNLRKEKDIVNELINETSGLIVCPVVIKDKNNAVLFKQLQKRQFPFVFVDRYYAELECDYSGADNYSGSYLVTESLIKKGHSRIAHLMSPSRCSTVRERLEGYVSALEKYSINVDNTLIREISFKEDLNYNYFEEISAVIDDWNRLAHPPTAITTTADGFAVITLKVLLSKGYKVPGDIALTGFDNSALGALAEVSITSVDPQIRRIGVNAANILLDRLKNRDFSGCRKTVLSVTLIERSSSVPSKPNYDFKSTQIINKELRLVNF